MREVFIAVIACISLLGHAQDKSDDFDQFCRRFFGEREFQMSHIAFPVVSVQPNEDGESLDTLSLDRTKWTFSKYEWGRKHNASTDAYRECVYDNFERKKSKTLRRTHERLVSFEGIENGISVHYFFKLMDKKWMLVRHEDLSD